MAKIKVNLCKCNNCDETFIDDSPQVDAPLYPITENEYKHLAFNSGDDPHWECPNCHTDQYLMDL